MKLTTEYKVAWLSHPPLNSSLPHLSHACNLPCISPPQVACVPGDNFYLGDAARSDPQRGGRYLRFTFVRSLETLRAAAEKLKALEVR